MRGQKRPLDEAARAVGLATVVGISEASRQTGIPRTTIQQWYDSPEYVELRQRNKEVRDEEWNVGVQLAFRRAVELLAKTDDPVKAATTGAILFDKLALSTGQATSRSESKDLTHDLDPGTRRRVIEWIDSHADRRGDNGDPVNAGSTVRESAAD